MKKCNIKDRKDLITAYLAGELTESDSRNFEEHYFQCADCFKELRITEDAMSIIRQEGASLQPSGDTLKGKSSSYLKRLLDLPAPKRWGIAAAGAAALILIFMVLFIQDDKDKIIADKMYPEKQSREQVVKEDNEPGNKDIVELTGASFKTVPYMEEWITGNVRSGNEKIASVISPKIGERLIKKDINFKWRMAEKDMLSLKIMDNVEKEILIVKPRGDQFPLYNIQVNTETFRQSGLYYWRIENQNEVLYTGKFYFIK